MGVYSQMRGVQLCGVQRPCLLSQSLTLFSSCMCRPAMLYQMQARGLPPGQVLLC